MAGVCWITLHMGVRADKFKFCQKCKSDDQMRAAYKTGQKLISKVNGQQKRGA